MGNRKFNNDRKKNLTSGQTPNAKNSGEIIRKGYRKYLQKNMGRLHQAINTMRNINGEKICKIKNSFNSRRNFLRSVGALPVSTQKEMLIFLEIWIHIYLDKYFLSSKIEKSNYEPSRKFLEKTVEKWRDALKQE